MRISAGEYEIDDDLGRVDAEAAVAFLTTEAYWGKWRGAADIKGQIAAAWRVVGAYDLAGAMVGFARAFADGGCAYLADVYVLPGHRGAGLGKAIVKMMIEDGPGAGWRWLLHTSDAHGLYRQFGFARPDHRVLERRARTEGDRPRSRAAAGTLVGKLVRLEPLQHQHVTGLLAAAARGGSRTGQPRGGSRQGQQSGPELYRWSAVPQDEARVRQYVETAVAARDGGTALPFAVIRTADDTVIGSTRFFDFDYWAWPAGNEQGRARTGPDTCEIGYTWLSPAAIRTGANTEMKRLMLTHAFEVWQVASVALHTDARNQRSRDAMARIGLRYEGVLRAHRLGTDLKPRDSARFSVTAGDWPAVRLHLDELDRRYQRS
jgi:RimJ/RimL family protein N-acetyltransferase/GNAT superfamily N-acetyltransferase